VAKLSIIEQRQAVEALIDRAYQEMESLPCGTLEAAKQAVLTLGFIERNPELARSIVHITQEFPDAKFVGVR